MAKFPQIIAEVGLSHDGSLGTAHAYIDAAASAGASGVKFQTHIAEAESSLREPWRTRFSPQDATRYDYWTRTAFTEPQWAGLRQHAKESGLLFLSSAFSEAAVSLLDRVGVDAWKVASGEVSNERLLRRMAETGRPLWISSGMSSYAELDRAVALARQFSVPYTVFQCTSKYPCPPEDLGLQEISHMAERYGCDIGLSDHSGTIFSGLAAVTLGAVIVEVHVTYSRAQYGPDVPVSLTFDRLRELVDGAKYIHKSLSAPYDKNEMAESLQDLRDIFTKSLVCGRPLPAGIPITAEDLVSLKPGDGVPVARLGEFIGRRPVRDLPLGYFIADEDFESE